MLALLDKTAACDSESQRARARPLEIVVLRGDTTLRTTRGLCEENALRNALLWLRANAISGDVCVCYNLSTGRLVFEAHWAEGESLIHWFRRTPRSL